MGLDKKSMRNHEKSSHHKLWTDEVLEVGRELRFEPTFVEGSSSLLGEELRAGANAGSHQPSHGSAIALIFPVTTIFVASETVVLLLLQLLRADIFLSTRPCSADTVRPRNVETLRCATAG